MFQFQADGIEVPCWINILADLRRSDARNFLKSRIVTSSDLPSSPQIRFEPLELFNPKGTRDVGQTIVEPRQNHLVKPLAILLALSGIAADPVVSKTTKRLSEYRIVSGDHSPFAGRQMFHRVKAEHLHVRNASHSTSAILGPEGVTSIFYHDQTMLFRERRKYI